MKKDKKFLSDLENELQSISKIKRDAIVLKYKNIIEEELKNKKRIKTIIKELGDPCDIAKQEIKELKKDNKINFSSIKSTLSQLLKNILDLLKKVYIFITKERQLKTKSKNNKKDKIKLKTKNKEKNKSKKVKKQNNTKLIDKIKKLFKKKKSKKTKETIVDKTTDEVVEEVNEIVEKIIEIPVLKEKEKSNVKLLDKFINIFKKKKSKKTKETIVDKIDKTTDKVVEEVNEIVEEVISAPILMTKKQKIKRIIFKTIGIIVVTILFFVWLWINVIFVASLFAILDGIKFFGVNIAIFGIDFLMLVLILMLCRLVFGRKNKFKNNLVLIIISILIIAFGVGKGINELSKITIESDVTQKYTMSTKNETYNLPSGNDKIYITFNSNYDTQYTVKYDKNLNGKVKIEVKYFENYYDYYVKKSSNNIYISLGMNTRDRVSSYIDDLKENKIYKNDELSRYSVKITINEKDFERLIIN